MGAEAKCLVRFGRQKSAGKALLESEDLRFSGDFRLKIPFRDIKSLTANDGKLTVNFGEQTAVFELGNVAERWAEKIRNPKTRIEKLGVRAGDKVQLTGSFDDDFLAELNRSGAEVLHENSEPPRFHFVAADSIKSLSKVLPRSLAQDSAIWIVYPKGQTEIREIDVLNAGRARGWVDIKVTAFSASQTAHKFVLPKVSSAKTKSAKIGH
jgi:hypothetical protein